MLLSFVIPTYNRAAKVKRAIDSILCQPAPAYSFEIVVVDDGSTDQTRRVLGPYIESGKIRYFRHEQNRGVAAAKNTGILNSRHAYVVLLDSDDLLDTGAMNYLLEFVKGNRFDLIFFGSRILNDDRLMYDPHFRGIKTYQQMLTTSIGEYLPVCRTEVMKQNLLKNLRGYESLTWLSIARQGFSVYYDCVPLRLYDNGGNDRLSNRIGILKNSRKMREGYSVYLKEYGEDLKKLNFRQFLSVNLKYLCYSLMLVLDLKR